MEAFWSQRIVIWDVKYERDQFRSSEQDSTLEYYRFYHGVVNPEMAVVEDRPKATVDISGHRDFREKHLNHQPWRQ
jgi:hypothetical protein